MNWGELTEHADITGFTWHEEGGLEAFKLDIERNDGGLEIQKFEISNDENF